MTEKLITEEKYRYRCLEKDDKPLILKVIDSVIDKEEKELREIKNRKIIGTELVYITIRLRSKLIETKEQYTKDLRSLKNRVESYPQCKTLAKTESTTKEIE